MLAASLVVCVLTGCSEDNPTGSYAAPLSNAWTVYYGDTLYDQGFGLDISADGSIFACGSSYEPGGDAHLVMIKLSPLGDTLWTRRCRSEIGPTYGRAAACHIGNSVYGLGYVESQDKNLIYLVKFKSDGETLFTCIISTGGIVEVPWDVCVTNDLGLAVAGVSDDHAVVIKLDWMGNVQWSRAYGGGQTGKALGIAELDSGELAVVGELTDEGAQASNQSTACVLRLDSDGDSLWTVCVPESRRTVATDVEAVDKENVLVCYNSYDVDNDSWDTHLRVLDGLGNVVFQHDFLHPHYHSTEWASSVLESPLGCYTAIGWTDLFGNLLTMRAQVQTDGTAPTIGSLSSAPSSPSYAFDAAIHPNGDVVYTGWASRGDYKYQMFVYREGL